MGVINIKSGFKFKAIEVTAGSGGVVGGAMNLISGMVGVYFEDAAVGAQVSFVYQADNIVLPKAAATAGPAFAQGAKVYFDNTAKKLTATASGNTLCGRALKAAAALDTTVQVDLTGNIAA